MPRTNACLRAAFLLGSEERKARLIDISRTGARVSGENLPHDGQEVCFRIGNVQVLGEVVRSDKDHCAVAFDLPMATIEVNRIRELANFLCAIR